MKRRRQGQLTPEDRALWDQVRRTVAPLRSPEAEALGAIERLNAAPEPLPPVAPVKPPPAPRQRPIGPIAAPAPVARQPARKPPEPIRMDARLHKSMRRGNQKPQARLDLHGMTLGPARDALVHFVLSAAAQGLRHLLVITGKGRPNRQEPGVIERSGALRRQVPVWLDLPPLGDVVLEVLEAHQRHGGAGAFYVYLRRPPGRGQSI